MHQTIETTQVKKNRPIASGKVSIQKALLLAVFLLIIALTISFEIGIFALVLVLLYLLMNVFYSIKFKHVVLVDVFIISAGFMLRLLMGDSGIGIEPSRWIILCALMITLFLGFAKRKSELMAVKDANITRKVLDDYSHLMLDIFLSITAACSIICYSLFIIIGAKYQHIWVTVPFVIFGIFRYIYMLLLGDSGQDTSTDMFKDQYLLGSFMLFIVSYLFVILYWK